MDLPGRILKTTTADGLELAAVLFEPKKTSSTVVIHLHGKEGDFLQNHFIEHMAVDYPRMGYAFMSATHRGKSYMADILRRSATGYEYAQLGSAFDIFEDSEYDIDAWVQLAKKLGYKYIILQQHSTPQKIVWYTYKNPSKVVGLILLSPADIRFAFETMVRDYKKNLLLANKLVKLGKSRELMPVTLWSNCPVSAGTFSNWGNPNSPIQEFTYSFPEEGFKYFPKVRLPILAILGENDFAVGEPAQKCLDILKEKTHSVFFFSHVIKNAAHSYMGQEPELTKVVIDWLRRVVKTIQ